MQKLLWKNSIYSLSNSTVKGHLQADSTVTTDTNWYLMHSCRQKDIFSEMEVVQYSFHNVSFDH